MAYGTNKQLPTLPKFKITTKLVSLADNGVFHLIDCTLGNINAKPVVLFVPTLASRDDVAIDFRTCKNLPNLLVVLSETNKVFLLDAEQGHYVVELNNAGFNLSKDYIFLASKDSLLFLKSNF